MIALDKIVRYPQQSRNEFSLQDIFTSLKSLIGNTPMIEIHYVFRGERRKLYAKCEYANNTGSIKDRMALYILEQAHKAGKFQPGNTIVEVTSGNTGISFAAIGSKLKSPVKIIMPAWLSEERKKIIRSYGAEVRSVLRHEGGFLYGLELAEKMAAEDESIFLPRQFSNQYNVEVHERTTGREIWEQLRLIHKQPDAFVAGVGSGGTVMGVGKFLKSMRDSISVHPLEPAESPTLTEGKKVGEHRIQGISDDFIPEIVKLDKLDAVIQASDGDAILMAQKMASKLGIGVGISSGANLVGAINVQHVMGSKATVVTVLPDCNKKYFSTDLMAREPFRNHYISSDVELLGFHTVPRLNPTVL